MAIRASSSKHVDALIAQLTGPDEVAREAAIARLAVIGARSVDRLIDLVSTHADGRVRASALRALEGIGDDRALAVALRAVGDPDWEAASAAIAVARVFLRGPKGAEAVDRLTEVALDGRRPERIRISAINALRDLDRTTIAPLMKKLATDANATIRDETRGSRGSRGSEGLQGSEGSRGSGESRGSEGSRRPEGSEGSAGSLSPEEIRNWLAREGAKAPLSSLLGVVERVREREGLEPASRRNDWAAVRFAAHLALGRRRSRVALYDLRESLEAAKGPLPPDAPTALTLVGDASCLEPIASAYTRSKNAAWRQQLLEAFHAIVVREKLTPRHAVMKKVFRRWPAFAR